MYYFEFEFEVGQYTYQAFDDSSVEEKNRC